LNSYGFYILYKNYDNLIYLLMKISDLKIYNFDSNGFYAKPGSMF